MMQNLRNNMKVIFYVIIFFFVGWMAFTLTGFDEVLIQQSRQDYRGMKYAGVVDNENIARQDYQNRVRQAVESASSQRPAGGLSSWEVDQISEQVWSEMVNDILLSDVFKRHEIRVTDAEVVEYIRSNPIPELMNEPSMQTDGRFDYDKYQSLLADPRAAMLVMDLENDARSKIPNFKLFLDIASLYKITDNELRTFYRASQETVRVEYVRFSTDSLVSDSEVEVSDQELRAYYDDNKAEFERPDIAALSLVALPVLPSAADTAAVRDTLLMLLDSLSRGVSWDSLSIRYSHGPLAAQGGDLGWFAKGDFQDDGMTELAFSLRPGQTSEPTVVESGMMIVRLDSVKVLDGVRRVRARRIVRNIDAGRDQLNAVRTRARNLRNLMRLEGSTMAGVAADSGLIVESTGPFVIGSQIPGLQAGRELMDYAYSASVGSISYPISVLYQGSESVAVIRVDERVKKGVVPFEEAAQVIRERLALDKKKPLAEKKVREIMADYDRYESLSEFAAAKNLPLESPPEFSRLTGLASVGRNNEFVGTAFGLPVGTKSDLIATGDDHYLLQVVSRTEVDPDEFEPTRERLAQQLVGQRMQSMFSLFSNELYQKARIEDLRDVEISDSLMQQRAEDMRFLQ